MAICWGSSAVFSDPTPIVPIGQCHRAWPSWFVNKLPNGRTRRIDRPPPGLLDDASSWLDPLKQRIFWPIFLVFSGWKVQDHSAVITTVTDSQIVLKRKSGATVSINAVTSLEDLAEADTSAPAHGDEAPVAVGGMRMGRKHLMLDTSWQEFANCLGVDPDLFFPERGASTREAKEVCRGCVVRPDCLEFALANGEKFGIWGGMSERERRRIRRQRALERQQAAPLTVTSETA